MVAVVTEQTLRAYQAVPMEVVYDLTGWVRTLAPEHMGAAALVVNRLIQLRNPGLIDSVRSQKRPARAIGHLPTGT